MSAGNLVTKLNRRFGVGIQKVRLYRIRKGEAPVWCGQSEGIEISLLTHDWIAVLQKNNPTLDLGEWAARLGNDNLCYCALRSGLLVHYTWVQTSGRHRILRAGRYKQICAGEFWIYECWTSIASRGLGIYPSVLSRVVCDLLDRGWQEGVIYTTPQNVASQRGILKAGFRYDRTFRSIRLGRHYFPI